jgi:hypothetical protein
MTEPKTGETNLQKAEGVFFNGIFVLIERAERIHINS